MTTDHTDRTVTPFDADSFPLVDPFPPFSWVVPTDAQVRALLAQDPDLDDFQVTADSCQHVEQYGQVVSTPCGLHLCGDCASGHDATGCPTCDADARWSRDPDD